MRKLLAGRGAPAASATRHARRPIRSSASTSRTEYQEPDLRRTPLAPEEDLLLFIRDHNRYLAEWERDLLTIVHEEAQYFIPQIETKIMNEGWASYWHKRILDSLELPPELHLEFIVRHNQVVRPHPGGINPYHVGLRVWEDIDRRYDEPTREEARARARRKTGTSRSSRSARPIATSRSCAGISARS